MQKQKHWWLRDISLLFGREEAKISVLNKPNCPTACAYKWLSIPEHTYIRVPTQALTHTSMHLYSNYTLLSTDNPAS